MQQPKCGQGGQQWVMLANSEALLVPVPRDAGGNHLSWPSRGSVIRRGAELPGLLRAAQGCGWWRAKWPGPCPGALSADAGPPRPPGPQWAFQE